MPLWVPAAAAAAGLSLSVRQARTIVWFRAGTHADRLVCETCHAVVPVHDRTRAVSNPASLVGEALSPSKEVQLTSLPHFTANTGRRQCRLPDRTDYITWLLQIGFKAHIHFIREHVGIVQTIPSCSSKAIYHRCNKRKRGTHHVVKEWPISYSTMKHQVPMSVQSSKGLANFRALLS